MAFKRSAVRSRLAPPKRTGIKVVLPRNIEVFVTVERRGLRHDTFP